VPTRLSSISCPASCSRLARPPKRSPPPPVAARTYRFKGLPSLPAPKSSWRSTRSAMYQSLIT
jgi:hypothetical protein